MTLGKVIKQLREGLALSIEELASHFDIEPTEVELWEADKAQPSREQMQILADLFHIGIEDLVNGRIPVTTPELLPIAPDALFFKYVRRFSFWMALSAFLALLSISVFAISNDWKMELQLRLVLFFFVAFITIFVATLAALRYSWLCHRYVCQGRR